MRLACPVNEGCSSCASSYCTIRLRSVQLSHLKSEIVIWILVRAKQSGQSINDCPHFYPKTGEPWRARTSDPLIKSQLLYQLS